MATQIALASLAGTGIQAAYAWMAFNRDNYALNVGLRQSQQYQEKNYRMSWVCIAREDIKEMMGVAVHHAADYVTVSSMLFSATVLAFATATFPTDAQVFLMFAFYVSGCCTLIFLVLSMPFGMKAQHSAYENTMKLLTDHVRPDNPSDHKHDYMNQAESFESMGVAALFRLPTGLRALGESMEDGSSVERPERSESFLEEMDKNKAVEYLRSFNALMHLWEPSVEASKVCLGLGIICVTQAFCYFTVGKIMSHGSGSHYFFELLGVMVVLAFVYLTSVLVDGHVNQNLKLKFMLLTAAGPSFAAVAAAFSGVLQAIMVFFSFLSHFAFWAVAYHKREQQPKAPAGKRKRPGKAPVHQDGVVPSQIGQKTSKLDSVDLDDVEVGVTNLPTDFWQEEIHHDFNHRQGHKMGRTKRLMRASMATAAALWVGMLAWSVAYYFVQPTLVVPKPEPEPMMRVEAMNVKWPSPLYHPRHLACAAGHVFSSDGCRVFEVFPSKGATQVEAQEIPCGSGHIVDLAVTCDGQVRHNHCKPAIMVSENWESSRGTNISICGSTSDTAPLSQLAPVAAHVGTLFTHQGERMLVSMGNELVVYALSGNATNWSPEWGLDLWTPETSASLKAISSSEGTLMLFWQNAAKTIGMGAYGAYGAAIERRKVDDMPVQDRWWLPPTVSELHGGCAVTENEVFLLTAGKVLLGTFV